MNYCLDIFVIKSLLLVDITNLQKKRMKWQKINSCFNWNTDPVMLSQSAQLPFIRHTYTTHSQQSRIERALGIFINCSQGISHASYTKWSWRQFPPVWAAATQSKLNGDWRRHLPLPHRTYVPSTESAGAGHRYTRLAALQRRRLLILRVVVVEQQYIWLTLEVVV